MLIAPTERRGPLKSEWNRRMPYQRLYRAMQLELIVVGDFNGAT